MLPELLFHRFNIFDLVEQQKRQLKDTVLSYSERDLAGDEVDVITKLVQRFAINVPILDESAKYATKREIDIDVSHDPNRVIFDRSEPFYVRGTEITVHIPFTGDAALFEAQPTHWTFNPPRGEVVENELQRRFSLLDGRTSFTGDYEATLTTIRQYLDWLKPSAEQLREELARIASSTIALRKLHLSNRANALDSLGIPLLEEREVKPPPLSDVFPRRRRTGKTRTKQRETKWDVFISHASEDKPDIAQPLAEALKKAGLRVWYDGFSLKLGDSLRQSIDKGLASSRFGVVILSRNFFEKHWPAQELNGLATREVEDAKVILPVWHGVGRDEVRQYSPMLADRLAANTEQGLEHVLKMILEVVVD